jgi:hypothetical protein
MIGTMGGAALLWATLIGVFITPDGIVVGSDTALSDLTGQIASEQKFCVTGPQSVATLQGSYTLQDAETKATVELYKRFRELCSEVGALTSPVTLREQADRIANTLKADLVQFLERLPAAEVVRTYSTNRVIARIAVSGYGEKGPESVVAALGVATDRATNRWELQVSPLTRLTFSECGVRFHGQEAVVVALRTDKGVRIPPAELQKTDVARLAALLNGTCTNASTGTASSMFLEAVRLTMTLGTGFGIPKGSVGLPVDLVIIPRDGAIDVRHIDSF